MLIGRYPRSVPTRLSNPLNLHNLLVPWIYSHVVADLLPTFIAGIVGLVGGIVPSILLYRQNKDEGQRKSQADQLAAAERERIRQADEALRLAETDSQKKSREYAQVKEQLDSARQSWVRMLRAFETGSTSILVSSLGKTVYIPTAEQSLEMAEAIEDALLGSLTLEMRGSIRSARELFEQLLQANRQSGTDQVQVFRIHLEDKLEELRGLFAATLEATRGSMDQLNNQ